MSICPNRVKPKLLSGLLAGNRIKIVLLRSMKPVLVRNLVIKAAEEDLERVRDGTRPGTVPDIGIVFFCKITD